MNSTQRRRAASSAMATLLQHASVAAATVRTEPRNTSSGLIYFEPRVPPIFCPHFTSDEAGMLLPRFLPPLQDRTHLATLLQSEELTRGVEIGVRRGDFAVHNLRVWKKCTYYLLVDVWAHQASYVDGANVNHDEQESLFQTVRHNTKPFADKVHFCRNFSLACASVIPNLSLDFVYVDARHDYKGCLEDLKAYWPKLRNGGIMAGHDYIYASEHPGFATGHSDYSVNYDGTRDPLQRAVKGAVDDFFTMCVPRQVVVTYRDRKAPWVTWMVRK